ncbi:hypothetical protein [Accumulibacter sp.]|uniref:hypothetical protein n=1 Tax=Accumulibacter sp. TaxID=2053492 RepID=UPI001AC7F9FA|nr:hypothetical protein [Accumulibacter sp.]MBN8454236.1 hypothetical protein [Accumulibacter sp.]
MQSEPSIEQWLTVVKQIAPPRGIVYAGAGSGMRASAFCSRMDAAAALFVEADEGLAARLAAATAGRTRWIAANALLADGEREDAFYVASSQNESSLIEPEKLTGVWCNLRQREARRLPTTTLDQLSMSAGHATDGFNWAIIDCFPAARILAGAEKSLEDWDVVLTRVLIDGSLLLDSGASKDEVEEVLLAKGYRCLALETERHPAVGLALYVRDWKAVLSTQLVQQTERVARLTQTAEQQTVLVTNQQAKLATLTQASDELQQERAALIVRREELENQVHSLTQARDEQAGVAADRQAQIAALTQASDELQQERAALIVRREELEKQVHSLTQARDEQARVAADRQAQIVALTQASDELQQERAALIVRREELEKQIHSLTQARDEQARVAADSQVQIADLVAAGKALEQKNSTMAEQRTALENQVRTLTLRHDEHAKLAAERQRQLAELQQQMEKKQSADAEVSARQQMLHEEVVRAEAQIDLIKDILLREPGL